MQPFIRQRADPHIYRHTDGSYYFTASVPAFDAIELRRAQTVEGLADAVPTVVWRRHPAGEMSCNIWAPELHYADGAWVIYFAAAQSGADETGCYDHRIYALTNTARNPLDGAFTEAGRVDTGWESFSLDATAFLHGGVRYFVWAQREKGIPGNSNLYIARMESATRLRLPATRLSVPEYDWECQGFRVNEGPAVLAHHDRLFLTYSASATDERYCVGMLEADAGSDLLNADSWRKSPVPVLQTEPENGLFGPGHNSFTTDADGNDVLVFHARPYPGYRGTALSDPNRHAFLRRIRYGADDRPIFGCTNTYAAGAAKLTIDPAI